MRVIALEREGKTDTEGGEEDSAMIMKGLCFVESLPCLWLLALSLISSCGGKSEVIGGGCAD